MFLPFFDTLRKNDVPVSLREFLSFLEAMRAGLATSLHSSGDEALPYATSPYDLSLPRRVLHASLSQRFGLHSLLAIGLLDLNEINAAHTSPTPDAITQVGGELRVDLSPFTLRADSIASIRGGQETFKSSNLTADVTIQTLELSAGFGRFGVGPSLTHSPWRWRDDGLPGAFPNRRTEAITGVSSMLRIPVDSLSVALEVDTITPQLDESLAWDRSELGLSLKFFDLAGCVEVGIQGTRYATPEAFDLFFFANVGPF